MPDNSLAFSISSMVKSTGLLSSIPSKPKSFASLNFSDNDKSSFIIPNPKLFFKIILVVDCILLVEVVDVVEVNSEIGVNALDEATKGVNTVLPVNAAADFINSLLFILFV